MTVRVALLAVAAVTVLFAPVAGGAEPTPDVEVGRQIFTANCAMCHGNDANGMMGMHPSMRGAIDRLTREGVEITIRNGRDTNPPMPAFEGGLTDREIDHVIAYIDTLPTGPRNFGPDSDGGMMDGMMGGWMWLIPVLIVVVAIGAVLAVIRAVRSHPGTGSGPTPRETLDRRYAEGELSRDEYLQRRNDLTS